MIAHIQLRSIPPAAGEAAVLLVEQIWTAITDGAVDVRHARDREGLNRWLAKSAAVLGAVERRQPKELKSMFNVTAKPTFKAPVKLPLLAAGEAEPPAFTATFRALADDEMASFDLATAAGSIAFMRAAIVSLDDLVDDLKQAVPYSAELRDRLLGQQFIRMALARAYFDRVLDAQRGN